MPFDDASTADRIDPRTLSIALDDLLPAERTVCIDSGNFMGYPSMFLSVPDELGFCFTQAFQSIGLGLASAIGASIAQPHRLTVVVRSLLSVVGVLVALVALVSRTVSVFWHDVIAQLLVGVFGLTLLLVSVGVMPS